ncbi:TPA: hypothetical protein ACOVJJ_004908 [Klebsiella oxytoca]
MNRLSISTPFAIGWLILFIISGSIGEGCIINEAINALLVDYHPYELVARIGFRVMMLGTLMSGSWIFPGKRQEANQPPEN